MQRKIFGIIYFISFIIFPSLVLSPAVNLPVSLPLRLGIFCLLSVGGAFLFRRAWPKQGWGAALLVTTLGYASIYKLASFIPDVSSYPFSLGWSEGSRYYYASLWLSKQVYGLSVPPSVLHPTRYLLQALPFLIPGSSLWFSRFWQVILWVVTAALTSFLLVRRLALPARRKPLVITLSMILWGFIFLFQGPVYYHLQFMVILILWGFDRQRFWRNLILVLIGFPVGWYQPDQLAACAGFTGGCAIHARSQCGKQIFYQIPHPPGCLGAGRDGNWLRQPISIPAVVG